MEYQTLFSLKKIRMQSVAVVSGSLRVNLGNFTLSFIVYHKSLKTTRETK